MDKSTVYPEQAGPSSTSSTVSLNRYGGENLSLYSGPFFTFLGKLFYRMADRRTVRCATIADFIFYRFVGHIVSDIRIRLFDRNNSFFLTYTDTLFDDDARFRINLNIINGSFTRRFDRFDDIFDFFRDSTFMDFYSFQVTLTIDSATRDRMRTSFKAFADRIRTRTFRSTFISTFDGTCTVFIDMFFSTDSRFHRFFFQDTTLEALFQDFHAFVGGATSTTCGFFRRSFLLVLWCVLGGVSVG